MAKEVLSHDVIDLIEKSKNDGFSDKEKAAISNMMKGLSESDLGKVKNHIQEKVTEGSKTDLLSLTDRIESFQNLTYGFDGIKESTKSEVFKKVAPLFEIWFSIGNLSKEGKVSDSKVKTLLGVDYEALSESNKDTINLVVWNRLTKSLNIPNLVKVKMDSFFGKITDGVKSMGSMFEKKEGEDSDALDGITGALENFEKLENPLDEKEKEDALGGIQEFINNLLKKDFENLKSFNKLIKDNNLSEADKEGLLSNPMILDSVLENGFYKSDSINIDLKSNKLNISKSQTESDIKTAQDKFMSTAAEFSDTKGMEIEGKVNKAKEYLDKLMGVADKMGLTTESLDDIKDKLFKLPIIGFFFKLMLGGFFDKMGSQLDSMGLTEERKKSSTELLGFLGSDKKINLGNEEVVVDLGKDKFNATNLKDFYNIVEKTNETKVEGEKSVKLYKKPTFWNELLTGENISDPYMTSIRAQVVKNIGDKKSGEKISKDDFIEALNNIKVLEIEKDNKNNKDGSKKNNGRTLLAGDGTKKQEPTLDNNMQLPTNGGALASVGILTNVSDNSTGTGKMKEVNTVPTFLQRPELLQVPDQSNVKVDQEVVLSKTISEQLDGVNSFPFDLDIDGKIVAVDFDKGEKKLKIGDKFFGITQMNNGITNENKEGISLKDHFSLSTFEFKGGDSKISLLANESGKLLIQANNIMNGLDTQGDIILKGANNDLIDYELSKDIFNDLIEGLVVNNRYEYLKIDTEGKTTKLIIS